MAQPRKPPENPVKAKFVEFYSLVSGGAAAFCPLSWSAWPLREIATNTMKPYVLDDASTFEYQRLDLMSKILDPWTRGTSAPLGSARVGNAGS
jgi:hypothetical protein